MHLEDPRIDWVRGRVSEADVMMQRPNVNNNSTVRYRASQSTISQIAKGREIYPLPYQREHPSIHPSACESQGMRVRAEMKTGGTCAR